MVQVAKTEETPFEEFAEQHIQKVNDDWGTPLREFRLVGTNLDMKINSTHTRLAVIKPYSRYRINPGYHHSLVFIFIHKGASEEEAIPRPPCQLAFSMTL